MDILCSWRRILLLVLVLLFVPILTLAAKAPEVTSVQLGISNDLWSNGLSRNDDDQDSFALFSLVETDKGWLRLDAHGITNRGWRTGWVPGDGEIQGEGELYRGRYDDVELLLGHDFTFARSGLDELHLEVEAGATFLGKLGMEFLQNSLHHIAGIHDLELPQDLDEVLVRPALNLSGYYDRRLMHIGHGKLSARLEASLYCSFSLFYQENVRASVVLNGKNGDYGYISLGYNQTQVTSGIPTQKLLGLYLNSPQFAFGFQAGAIKIDYNSYIVTDYGLTRLTVDLVKLKNLGSRSADGRSDIPLAFAAYSFTPTVNFVSVGFELPVEGKENWYLVAIDQYTAGTPIYKDEERTSDTFTDPRKKLNDAYLTAGAKRVFPLSVTEWVEPFVYGAGGLAILRYDELRNMVDTYKEPSYSFHSIRPCVNLGVGIQTGNMDLPVIPFPPFDLYMACGVILTPGVTKVTPTGVDLNRSFALPYLQFGIAVDMDV